MPTSTAFPGAQKAVAALVVTLLTSGLTALLTALQALPDGAGIGDLDTSAWVTIVLAVLASTGLATGAVYGVRNKGAGTVAVTEPDKRDRPL